MHSRLRYADATTQDAGHLSWVAINSKKMWGYDDALIELWLADLEITSEYISANKVVKVFDRDNFIGFYAIKVDENGAAEIDHLWLMPEHTRKNYGRKIFSEILRQLSIMGFTKATLVAEPNAVGFYKKMNGVAIKKFESKVSGRFLEIYEFWIAPSKCNN